MAHVVHTFDEPLTVVVHEDGVVISSPKGYDVVLTPRSAKATGDRLIHGSKQALSAPPRAGDRPAPSDGAGGGA